MQTANSQLRHKIRHLGWQITQSLCRKHGVLYTGALLSLAACQSFSLNEPANQSSYQPISAQSTRPLEDSEIRKKARVRLELASNYLLQKNYKAALPEFENAIQLDPSWAETYAAYGVLYLELGDKAQAEKLFKKALSLDYSDVSANLNYGWVLCLDGRYEESIKLSLQAAKNPWHPNRYRGFQNAGLCALDHKKYDKAEEWLIQANEMQPRNAVILFSLSRLFYAIAQYERATYFIEQMEASFEPNPEVLWMHIKIARARGEKALMLKLSQDLQRLFPAARETTWLTRSEFDK